MIHILTVQVKNTLYSIVYYAAFSIILFFSLNIQMIKEITCFPLCLSFRCDCVKSYFSLNVAALTLFDVLLKVFL